MSENYYYSISKDDYRKKKTITIGHNQDGSRDFIIIPDYRDSLKQELLGLLGFTLIASFFITVFIYTFIPSAIISAMLIGLTVVIISIVCESPFVPFTKQVSVLGKAITSNICSIEDLSLIKDHVPDNFDSCLSAIQDFEETKSTKAKDFVNSALTLAKIRKKDSYGSIANNVDSKWEFEESVVKQEISIEEEMKNIGNSSL